jgi:hypothetical protein
MLKNGIHEAELVMTEPYRNDHGRRQRFVFRLMDGELISTSAAASSVMRGRLGHLVSGMLGRAVEPEEFINLELFVGQRFLLVTEQKKSRAGVTFPEVLHILPVTG